MRIDRGPAPEVFGDLADQFVDWQLEDTLGVFKVTEDDGSESVYWQIAADVGEPGYEVWFLKDPYDGRVIINRAYRKDRKFLLAQWSSNAIEMTGLAVAARQNLSPDDPVLDELVNFVKDKLRERRDTAELLLGKIAAAGSQSEVSP